MFTNSPYLQIKDKLHRRIIRWAFYRFVDEIYLPSDSKVSTTYKGDNRRGLRIGRTKQGTIGVQEEYFDMPEDLLKK